MNTADAITGDRVAADRAVRAAGVIEVPPVILYGALRSGTTMLRLMLDMHPQLSCPTEADFLFDHLRPSGGGWILDRNRLLGDRIFMQSSIAPPLSHHGQPAVAAMVAALAAKKPQARLILLLHRGLDAALALLPDAHVIHLVRDPRDVAISSVRMGWAGDVYHAAQHWVATEHDWDSAATDLAGRPVAVLHFEQLVDEPREQLARLCDFLGVGFDPAMLHFHETSSYRPVDSSSSFRWQRNARLSDVALIESAVGPLIAGRGYSRSQAEPVRLTRARLLWVKLRGKAKRLGFRIDRYGLRDTLLESASNRLGLPWLGRNARLRIMQEDLRHLE
ncbi:MAG: sulfotransferase [Paracoccus sp. (in: a-proteobacteria)]|uniref:sulfotransferase family protein n=1 Tax=Paracoccus sp. TaxID=267 RepID=UPI0026E0427F|nr:sulfotransferase [Paracoccus sp. (in: a-proteobacteria)]MDO5632104.1 sulfotransferase [Paracoccus sp. (in: a-proteobacteria)]